MTEPIATKSEKDKSSEQAEGHSPNLVHHSTPSNPYAGIRALQCTAGNQAVSQMFEAGMNGLPPVVEAVLKSENGQPLDASTRGLMEASFDQDFSQVVVHTDLPAAKSAQKLNARAYTVGKDIIFAPGAYSPSSQEGYQLLAHELAHVVQQSKGSITTNRAVISQPGDPSEIEAEDVSRTVASEQETKVTIHQSAPIGQIQGQWEYIKDKGKHIKQPVHRIKREPGEAKGEEGHLAETSEEVALHTREVLAGAKFVVEKLSKAMKNDQEVAKKLERLAENFEEASKLVETGEKGFNKIKKGIEIKDELTDLYNAVKALNDIKDVRVDPDGAAMAFDDLFTVTGKLAKHLPDGPWQGYFELLVHFKDHGGFFLNITRALGKHTRAADRAYEGTALLEPKTAPEAQSTPGTLEEVRKDIERKFAKAQNILRGSGEPEMERFRAAIQHLLELEKKAQGGWLQRTFGKPNPVVFEEMKPVANEVREALLILEALMARYGDNTPEVEIISDIRAIEKYL